MKMRSKIVTCLVLALSISCLATGCKKKAQETETSSETIRVTEKQTESETAKKATNTSTTFKSKDGSISIKLPDDTWTMKKEGTKEWTFESPNQGTITIVHYSGDETNGLVFPSSEEEVLNNLEKAGKSKTDYAVVEYKKNTMGSYEAYHTTIKCKSTNSKYAYSVAYNLVGDEDIYSVNGQVMQDDATAMEAIRTSVESLKLLKTSSTTTSETKKNNTTSSESNSTTQSESGSTASTDGNSDSNQNGQYVYDSNGNAVYIYQDSDGNWVDSSGAIYYFNANGITNSNGASFTYNPQGGNSDNNNNNGGNDNNGGDNNNNNGGATQTSSFYDNQGNLITVYKNSNGNWVDGNGIVYTFGQYGVTDNYGNYYPYSNSGNNNGNSGNNNGNNGNNNNNGNNGNNGNTGGSTNGFYDDQGNYISVTQDANGNWVDSGGMQYTFGNDGVTDANGNFYPY